jgi:hypothetical protein
MRTWVERWKGFMQKTFRGEVVLSCLVLMLLSAPTLCSQDVDEKRSADKAVSEQNTVEKNQAHPFGERCDSVGCVTKVLYLSNLTQPTELQDVVNMLRAVVEIPRVQIILSAQVIVLKGTPEQVALGEKLANEVDKARRKYGAVGYRLDFKVNESEGSKKPHSRVYSLVTDARESAKLDLVRQLPVQGQGETASESKQTPDALSGQSIDCRILSENERTIYLQIYAAFSTSGPPETSEAGKPGFNSRASETQVRVRDHLTLELGKPTVIDVVDDPDSGHTVQIEVTATRIKERP